MDEMFTYFVQFNVYQKSTSIVKGTMYWVI